MKSIKILKLMIATLVSVLMKCEVTKNLVRGGYPVRPGQFPFLVAIGTHKRSCTGELIDEHHVMTAAHCLETGAEQVGVGIGCHRSTECFPREVSRIMIHHEFNYPKNDIAILKTVEKVEFNNIKGLGSINRIKMPWEVEHEEEWDRLTIAGWGTTEYSDRMDAEPRKVDVSAVSPEECEKQSRYRIGPKEMCWGNLTHGSGRGDSGGPLFKTINDTTHVLVGLASSRNLFGSRSDVYINVLPFKNWITDCIGGSGCKTLEAAHTSGASRSIPAPFWIPAWLIR